jgi:heparosan-N-sulfate-glucuronate 5-epimerase
MPLKEWRLLARDVSFYVSGSADVSAADWHAEPWVYPTEWAYQLDRESEYFLPKDADGIPVRAFRMPIGVQYLPSRIAAYGIAHWNRWLTRGSQSSLAEFQRVARWLTTAHVDGKYEHAFPLAGMPAGWISCIAQGEALSLLARAYQHSRDGSYLQLADRVAGWLLLPVEQGGLRSRLPDGSPFLEEYPGTEYRHVLNGCLYAAVGIGDLLRSEPDARPELRAFFSSLIGAIAGNIEAWDVDGWSTYDYAVQQGRPRNLNTMTYQIVQSVLLRYLADVSGDDRLRSVSTRWSDAADRLPKRIGALGGKLTYRLRARW